MEYHNNHYKQLKIEVQDFSQKWDLNGTEHSFLKYVSRCKFKNKDQDLVKANWFYNGETKNGTITREAIKIRAKEFFLDLKNTISNSTYLLRYHEFFLSLVPLLTIDFEHYLSYNSQLLYRHTHFLLDKSPH